MRIKVLKSDAVRSEWSTIVQQVTQGVDVLVERYNKPLIAIINCDKYLASLLLSEDASTSPMANTIRRRLYTGKLTAKVWRELKIELDDLEG